MAIKVSGKATHTGRSFYTQGLSYVFQNSIESYSSLTWNGSTWDMGSVQTLDGSFGLHNGFGNNATGYSDLSRLAVNTRINSDTSAKDVALILDYNSSTEEWDVVQTVEKPAPWTPKHKRWLCSC